MHHSKIQLGRECLQHPPDAANPQEGEGAWLESNPTKNRNPANALRPVYAQEVYMWKLRRLLPVGSVELLQVTGNALLNLSHAPLHLGTGEVLVSVVHRLELAAVNRNAGFRQQPHGAAMGTSRPGPVADSIS